MGRWGVGERRRVGGVGVDGGVGVYGALVCMGRWCVWGCLYCKVKGGWGYRVWLCIYVFNAGVEMSLSKYPRLRRSPRPLNLRQSPKFLHASPSQPLTIRHQNFYKSFGCVYVHCTPCFWGPLHDPAPLRLHRPKNGLNISTLFFLKKIYARVIFIKSLILKDF